MKKLMLLFALFAILGLQVYAQTTVTGTVTQASDGLPIPGANVRVKGFTDIGTITDLDGKYTLQVPNGATHLVFSFVGMKTTEIQIVGNVVNCSLAAEDVGLSEVVITGYGVTKKVAFTGAAQQVKNEVIKNQNDPNPMKALQGNVAGLKMNISTGQPGAASNITIRGLGSVNSGTQPLYVVDGIPISSEAFGMRTEEGQNVSPLATLSSSDIESINILKDATATSIYGSRAANGVIVITTKKGKEGKTQFNFGIKRGSSFIPARNRAYTVVNRDEYIDIISEGIVNVGWAATKDEAIAGMKDASWWGSPKALVGDEFTNTDWYKEVTRVGTTEDYSFDATGGNDKLKFFVSCSYLNDQGIVIGKDLQRYSGRINLENKASKYVTFGIILNGSYTKINNGAGGGYFSDPITQAYMQLPTQPVVWPDGRWNMETENQYNPVAQRSALGDKSTSLMYKAFVSPFIRINLFDDFTFMSRAGIDILNLQEFGRWSMLQPQGKDMGMLGEQGTQTRALWTVTNTLNYIKNIGENHHFNVLLGIEAQKANDDNYYLSAQNFPTDEVFTIANASKPTAASTRLNSYALASYFMNLEYDFANKYYLSASFRRDGSSKFGANNKWANFYSIGAKYRISQETFMKELKWVDNLTIRTSFGTVGNQDIDWYAARGLFGFGFNYNGIPGYAPTQYENPELKWEQTQKFNVGIDFSLFNRVSVELDYYNHQTKDMIFSVPLSYTTGYASILTNIGQMENTGLELLVNVRVINTNDLKWDLSFNYTQNKNKIVKLATDQPIKGTTTIRQVGESFFSFYLREYAGVNPDNGKPLWYKADGTTTSNYNQADQRILGSSDPKYYGGFGTTLSYKGLEFGAQFTYTMGNKVYGSCLRYDEHSGASYAQPVTEYVYDNRWTTPGQITDVPKFIMGGMTNANSHSSRFLMDGSYLRLKSLNLGYTLPKAIANKLLVSNIKVYIIADNLYTYTYEKDFRGLDPETGVDGILWWNYPIPRTFTFGINVSL